MNLFNFYDKYGKELLGQKTYSAFDKSFFCIAPQSDKSKFANFCQDSVISTNAP